MVGTTVAPPANGARAPTSLKVGVFGNSGKQFNSGGIVVLSAQAISHGSNPNFDTIAKNRAFRNHPADLIWDGTGIGVRFRANDCGQSVPAGFCH